MAFKMAQEPLKLVTHSKYRQRLDTAWLAINQIKTLSSEVPSLDITNNGELLHSTDTPDLYTGANREPQLDVCSE